ncbi:MAG: heme A synthase [Halodesulfurarchaeum sp.]
MASNTQYGTGRAVLRGYLPYRYLAGTTLVLTYIVMILGSYTGAIGAGLSCPDWPTCYGTWIPWLTPSVVQNSPYTALQIFAEWIHRGLAMVVGLLILGTAVAAWRVQGDSPLVKWSATLALVLLPIQVVLGGLTVTENLMPIIVTGHLAVAVLILALLTATFVGSIVTRNTTPTLV